jgi:hypothetical protein
MEDKFQDLTPLERQMEMARLYHYLWYNDDIYKKFQLFMNDALMLNKRSFKIMSYEENIENEVTQDNNN